MACVIERDTIELAVQIGKQPQSNQQLKRARFSNVLASERKLAAEGLKNAYDASKKKDAKSTKKEEAANKKTSYTSVDNVANMNTKRGTRGTSTSNSCVDDFKSYLGTMNERSLYPDSSTQPPTANQVQMKENGIKRQTQ
ncbi:conserved hypothetical protein [Ricinus communis]|uniref:Uncharacterized protein n=1 Tax=Ricinus communis TaxID=3988 RepID=B9S1T4_RICCO|nr:conserved hypothetical protein [Ricinus communis]